ncbi:Ldh family oxidoreductase [Aquamicrobium sp. LC103]|uniref:Ldh family oxidoreductase n=1 Tax=Aquamicrobium sp. LC103 TaxID=1120658 RepID=UPI00063ECDB8|nr:Ldh family oxidoreductase [Aquamicrobium sp. LC103]TKT77447.1 Ldh family oxidoreductase [Aquamicrobium sp. LC103]
MSDIVLGVQEAHALVVNALVASNTAPENARLVADALVGAELAGQGGHGLRRVPAYAAQARAGKVDGHAVPRADRIRPGAVHIDAAHGFAYPALALAASHLAEMAPVQGIAIAGISRSHHAGVAGLTVEALAERGLVALMFANSPPSIAPWGGRRPLFGTNPIAFACPVEHGEPIVVDVSLSKVARGRIMAANQKGEAIPEGWALDADGNPTTDAKAALAGTMVPMGDAKGTALALMVELLAAGLTGANFAYEQSSFFDAEGAPPGTGQAIVAIDPGTFGVGALARFGEMAGLIDAMEGARVPGHRRREIRERLMAEGIAVDTALLEEIGKLETV